MSPHLFHSQSNLGDSEPSRPELTLTLSPIRRRTYYPIIPVPPHTTRDTFYRCIRRSYGKGVSPFHFSSSSLKPSLSSIPLFLSLFLSIHLQLGLRLSLELPLTTSADNFADQFVDQKISISDYSLSASVACGKFCCATVSPCLLFSLICRKVTVSVLTE
jgi:hypothetical protein